jgi:hypothetical protein
MVSWCVPVTGQIDVLLTCDQSIRPQQNVKTFSFGVVILAARSNRLDDLLPLTAAARDAMLRVGPGEIVEVRVS